jgi:murein DD-endopeptidase MepM/ murein hydrolase activator NlpD
VPHSSESQHAYARRALIEDIRQDKKGWLQHGIAALAVSLLGLGIAGSVVLTGSAQRTATGTEAAVVNTASRGATSTSRSNGRPALDPAKVQSLADQRAEELSKANDQIDANATAKAAKARDKALAKDSKATSKQAKLLIAGRAVQPKPKLKPKPNVSSTPTAPRPTVASGKSCMPVTGGYSVAARFGQVGSWSRYHTGFDFAARVGTPLHAPASGVVTNAGGGPASGWAGNYVAIKYSDGTQTLMAHMSTVSVRVGQSVSACQVVGAIGMTGRTFGPHVHFEVYPAGITPGDVYRAVNPVGWLNAHGLHP